MSSGTASAIAGDRLCLVTRKTARQNDTKVSNRNTQKTSKHRGIGHKKGIAMCELQLQLKPRKCRCFLMILLHTYYGLHAGRLPKNQERGRGASYEGRKRGEEQREKSRYGAEANYSKHATISSSKENK